MVRQGDATMSGTDLNVWPGLQERGDVVVLVTTDSSRRSREERPRPVWPAATITPAKWMDISEDNN